MVSIKSADRAYLKKIQLLTRKKLQNSLHGPHTSARRGYGLEFDQLRSYESGDDIRFVDWKASARCADGLMIKQYLHDYTKNIVIALDISASMNYGSSDCSVLECAQRLALIISCVADYAKAKCSFMMFDNDIVYYRTLENVDRLCEIISTSKSANKISDFSTVFKRLTHYPLKNSLVFIVSDFINCNALEYIGLLNKRAEILALRINDVQSPLFKNNIRVSLYDNEYKDTHYSFAHLEYILKQRMQEQNNLLKRYNIAYKDFFCNASSYKELTDMLVTFFNQNVQLYC